MNSRLYIICSLGPFFGWLLSFPFHGPVFSAVMADRQLNSFSLTLFFILGHAATYFFVGLFIKKTGLWRKFMLWSLLVIIGLISFLWFCHSNTLWLLGMTVLGIASALFVVGWSYPYSTGVPVGGRVKLMATLIIVSNLFYIILHILSNHIMISALYLIKFIPLLIALFVVWRYPHQVEEGLTRPARLKFPLAFMLIFCLFIFGLYLNSGFMYSIVFPSYIISIDAFTYYQYIPYILVLLLMVRFGEKLRRHFSAYMGVSLLGLAFVSFVLLEDTVIGCLITQTLFESSFAFLDLFAWVLLGDFAFIYGAPFKFFGFGMAAMVGSIYVGGIFSGRLMEMDQGYFLATAMFAVAAIFLTVLIIPWLNERVNKDFFEKLDEPKNEGTVLDRIKERLPEGSVLTPRELEIILLVLKGMTNKEMAQELFISENTLKTHLKHIYQKVNVGQKRELLSLAVQNPDNKNSQSF